MSFKLITILKEALDVSWNPYEERNIKQYDELLNGYIRDVLMMAKDRSIYSKGLKKSEIPSEVYEQLRFEHDNHEGEVSGLDAIMENFSEDEVLERIAELLSRFNLKEAIDVSWNPYEESGFKVGDKVKNIVAFWSYLVLDKRQNWKDVEANPIKKSYIPTITDANEEDDMRPWYLLRRTDVTHARPYWEYEEALKLIEPTNEALDVSWNPYQESNHATRTYNFIDFDDSKNFINTKDDSMVVFFHDEDDNDLRTDVKISTGIITGGEEWDGDGDEVDLSPKIIEQLNRNVSIKKVLDLLIKSLREGLDYSNIHTEALDISWNPFEDHDYTVMMGKLDGNDSIVKHFTAKDEDSALLEFFVEYLGHNTNYAKTAINGLEEKTLLKNSFTYKSKVDDFFWIVAKGDYYKSYMAHLSKEYRLKYNI